MKEIPPIRPKTGALRRVNGAINPSESRVISDLISETGSLVTASSSGESRANLTSWRRRNLPAAARASYQRLIELGRLSPRARAQISRRHRRLPARDALGRGTCRRARCQPNARCHRRRQRRGQYGSGLRAQSALRGRSAIVRSAAALGTVRITNNPGGICRLTGMELQLGRDTTKADDYTTPVCTVTAFK